jgi:phosphatidylglycerol lysyltransferase
VEPDGVGALLPECRKVSDEWLAAQGMRERRFSQGRFVPDYLKNFPLGVVRRGRKITAFAVVWTSAGREEAAVDLIRWAPDAMEGTLEFLLAHAALWARHAGWRRFSLGLSPLAVVSPQGRREPRTPEPLWNRFGPLLERYADRFYPLHGLRPVKEALQPEWEPRFLAAPGGWALPRAVSDVADLLEGREEQ